MSVSAVAVRELHRIHIQLADLSARAERAAKQIKAREVNLVRLNEELTKAQAEHKASKIRADQKQLLLKSGEQKIENLRVKLNACSTNREYQALKDQIAADEMANSVLADEILDSLEKIDEHQRLVAEAQKKIAGAKEELAKVEQATREQQAMIEGDITRLQGELARAEAELPGEFRIAYDRVVNAKREDAMAEAQGDFCGGCNKQLTPNIFSELRMGRGVFCRACGRILYLPEDRSPMGK